MAILAIFTGRGITAKMYDELRREVHWEGDQPAGGVLHIAAVDAAGDLTVADVWDSQAQMEAFIGGRLGPAFAKLNIPPPTAQMFTVHHISAYDAVDRHKI